MISLISGLKLLSILRNKVFIKLLLLLSSFFLSSCTQDFPCIEADDFGFPKMTLYAKGNNVTGEEENQLSDWVASGYKYNGDQIVIMAYNPVYTSGGIMPLKYTWNPWLCQQEEDICVSMHDAPKCNFPLGYCSNAKDREETIDNAPCYLSQGEGLYLLVTYPASDITSPNTYDNINRMPYQADFYTKSLWDETDMYHNGVPAKGYSGELIPTSVNPDTGEETENYRSKEEYLEGEAYFKILDRYYEDNSGHQYVSIKRGFESVVPPPIASVISFVTDTMNDTSEELYKRIIVDYEYRLSLKILLVLYIVVHGILFIGGVSNMSQTEFMWMFIKLIIVIQLISGETSWQLFYDYFFRFFTSGLDEMINIVTSNFDNTNNGFTFFDTLLGLLFSYETSMKIQALIWSFPSGFVAAFIMYAAFALFTIAIAKAVMIYLLAYMAISLLIIVAPVFICFMLFNSTKPLFEGWLSQFLVFFMQAVMVMAALNLLAQIIVDQIYMILGFKACYEDWIVAGITSEKIVISKAWLISSDVSIKDIIEVPGYGYNDTSRPDYYCEPYECLDERYVELPFLDPDIEREADLIDDFKSPSSSLSIPMLYEATILLLMCYLMMKFNDVVPGLAKGIAHGGGSAGSTAIGNTANSAAADFKSALSGMKNLAGKIATGKSERERGIASRTKANENSIKRRERFGLGPDSKVAKFGSFVYSASGFVKDMILPPGSMMIGSPDEIKKRKVALKNAKEANRIADWNEGKQYNKSYRDQIGDYFKEKTGIAEMNRRAGEFDKTYHDENGKFLFKAAAKGIAKKAGEIAYSTDTGRALIDGAIGLKNAAVDEYKARFTEQGRIDRINASKIDNRIHVLATQYQQEEPVRDRADRLASAALDKYSRALNLDKEEFLLMDAKDQRKYADRAYAALALHKRNAEVDRAYNELKDHLETKGAILRTLREMDPNILTTEASDALGIDKIKFEKLNGKDQLAFLEKGLRSADINGSAGADAYRAYRYLKEKAEAKFEIEKFVEKENKRKQSIVYKAGEALIKVRNAPGELYDSVANLPKNIKSYIDKQRVVAHLEGEGTARKKVLSYYHTKYEMEKTHRIPINEQNADQVFRDACASLGINEATIQSMAPERRLAYIEKALNGIHHIDPKQDFEAYKGYRALKEIIEHNLVEDPLIVEGRRLEQEKLTRALKRQSDVASYESQYQRGKAIDVYKEKYSKESLGEELSVNQIGRELGLKEKDLLLLGMLDQKDQLEGITNQSAKLLGVNQEEFAKATKEDQSRMLNNALSNEAIDLNQESTYLAYKMLKRSIGDNSADQEAAILKQRMKQTAAELGISGSVFDLVDDKKVRSEMLLEKAGGVLGISEADLQTFNSLDSDAKLEMLNNALKSEKIDLSKPDAYAAYQTLRDAAGEVLDYGPKPITNPFDDNYLDPDAKSKSAELFGDDKLDFTANGLQRKLEQDVDLEKYAPVGKDNIDFSILPNKSGVQDIMKPQERSVVDIDGNDMPLSLGETQYEKYKREERTREIEDLPSGERLVEFKIKAAQDLGMSEHDARLFSMLKETDQLELVEQIFHSKEIENLNTVESYRAYDTLKAITLKEITLEQLKQSDSIFDVPAKELVKGSWKESDIWDDKPIPNAELKGQDLGSKFAVKREELEIGIDGNKGPLEESRPTIFDQKEKKFKDTPSKKDLFGDDEPL